MSNIVRPGHAVILDYQSLQKIITLLQNF